MLNSCLFTPLCLFNPFSFTYKVRIAKSSAPPFQNGFSSLGPNSTGKEASLSGTQGAETGALAPPAACPGCSQVTPGTLPQHLWFNSWNPPRLSWLSCSLGQISFSKAFHGVWMTASGSHQLDIYFYSPQSPCCSPRFPSIGRVLGTGVTFPLVHDPSAGPEGL